MATTSGREIYRLGREGDGNREVVILEAGTVHDLPAGALFAYSNVQTRFPLHFTSVKIKKVREYIG
jgi:hypothetical protein